MSDSDLVLDRCHTLETILKTQYGATGKGLAEQAKSIVHLLPTPVFKKLRYIAHARNRVAHDRLPLDDRARFIRTCDEAEQALRAGAANPYSAPSTSYTSPSNFYTSSRSDNSSQSRSSAPAINPLSGIWQWLFPPQMPFESDDRCTHCGHENYRVIGTYGLIFTFWERIRRVLIGFVTFLWCLGAIFGSASQPYPQLLLGYVGGSIAMAFGIFLQCLTPYVILQVFRLRLLLRCQSCSKTYASTRIHLKLSYVLHQAMSSITLLGLPLLIVLGYPVLKGWSWIVAIAVWVKGQQICQWFLAWYR
jgi:hypothetical protein